MEEELDIIAYNEENSIWYDICKRCTNEIKLLSKNVSTFYFCKKMKYKLFIIDNFKLSFQIKEHGLYLSANNKNPINLKFYKKNFEVIGSAHNQKEYFFKKKQNCYKIFLSPIFYNKKYSLNKILNVHKFNLITLDWKTSIGALGGINLKNLKLIQLTSSNSIGIKSLIAK
jgi:thiamine-phosphate pyrophosphorylase